MTPLESAALTIVQQLHTAGYDAFFVGGCVRDGLLGVPLKDIDIATDARPAQIEALFEGVRFVGKRFGVSLVRANGHTFEVATFRRDGAYLNHRHPDRVTFGTIEDDAERRDFTINALYRDPTTGSIVDLHGGRADLEAGVVRCVGDAPTRFREDALRLLRAIRFATRLGFRIGEETWAAMKDLAPTIEFISPERHREELTRILTGPRPGEALRLLAASGLLHFLLPEVEAMQGVEQGREFHPEGDVFEHTCAVLDHLDPRTPVNAWGALLHDVGKPSTFARDPATGRISFIEHERVGARMAKEILERLRFPTDDIETISTVVRRHMRFMAVTSMRRSTLRQFLAAPTIEHDLAVHRADCLGSNGRLDYWEFCHTAMAELSAESGSAALPKPFVTGHDVLALGVPPGPRVRELLAAAMEQQLEGGLADRETALDWLAAQVGV